MRYFDSHFVFAYILNCSTLTKFQLSVWSSAMPKEKESIKKINTSKRGIAQWLPDYMRARLLTLGQRIIMVDQPLRRRNPIVYLWTTAQPMRMTFCHLEGTRNTLGSLNPCVHPGLIVMALVKTGMFAVIQCPLATLIMEIVRELHKCQA